MLKKYKWTIYTFIILIIIFMISNSFANKKLEVKEVEPIVLRLAETFKKEHPSALATEYFASLVKERSNSRIQIKIYFDGELGNEKSVLEQMEFGGIALARINFLELSNIVTLLQQYVVSYDDLEPQALLDRFRENNKTISSRLQREKLMPFVWYYPDIRCFYNNKLMIYDLKDFRGLKLQTSQTSFMVEQMKRLEMESVNIQTENLFQSLNAGFIDGGETTLCEYILSDYTTVAPFVNISEYLYSPDCIVASTISLSKINRDDQQLLLQCAEDSFQYQKKLLLDMQKKSIEKLRGNQFFNENLLVID